MMISFKTYLSFVLLVAFVLSSHVLTHELPDEDINDEEVDPIAELTNDLSIGCNPKGNWGITIGPEPNDEFDEKYGAHYHVSRRYGGHRRDDRDDDDDDDDDDDNSDDDKYYTDPRNYHNHRHHGRGGRGGGDNYDDDLDNDKYYTDPRNHHNHRHHQRNGRGRDHDYGDDSDNKYYTHPRNHHLFKRHSSEFAHPQSSSLQNTKLKTYNLDGSVKKHRKIMTIPSKFDFWSSIPHKDGDKKVHEEVDKKPMN
ncbi:hypothetical protein PIB30_039639 [Stylosanthes scabra]|uniref:Uncharacterized protein n=1 Tax=Stylosanthes scabra TaxID=79078 RepID=A0ABU6SFC8_9FABA|nr:hypothetical protein [Stylosanthes scabra]